MERTATHLLKLGCQLFRLSIHDIEFFLQLHEDANYPSYGEKLAQNL
jgi:hypothetical protein